MDEICKNCKFYKEKTCNSRHSFFWRMQMDEEDECGTWEKRVETVNKDSISNQLNTGAENEKNI